MEIIQLYPLRNSAFAPLVNVYLDFPPGEHSPAFTLPSVNNCYFSVMVNIRIWDIMIGQGL